MQILVTYLQWYYTYVYNHISSQPPIGTTCSDLRTRKLQLSIQHACYTIVSYLIHAHTIYELCCCLLCWIILLSSSCNITKVDNLNPQYTNNLSIQSFVMLLLWPIIKVNIYHMYLRTVYMNSYSHIVPSSEAQYSLTLCNYVEYKR